MLTSKKTYQHRKDSILIGFLIFVATLCHASAQQVSAEPEKKENAEEQAVILSPFSVTTESDGDYKSENTVMGSRVARSIAEIPSAISIINSQMLRDLSVTHAVQAIQFGTAGAVQQRTFDDSYNLRGFSAGTLRNGVDKRTFKKNPMFDIERIEVIKGPASLLVGNSTLGGAINFITRPANEQRTVVADVAMGLDPYSVRGAVNLTGPTIQKEDVKGAFRLTVGAESGDRWREIERIDERFVGASLLFKFGDKTQISIDGSYYANYGYQYFSDFLDITATARDPATNLLIAKLNQYSTETFSPARQKNTYDRTQDGFVNVTLTSHLTDNLDLRMFYFGGNLRDDRDLSRSLTVQANNTTLTRQRIVVDITNINHAGQIDLAHKWDANYYRLDSTVGVDANHVFYRQHQGVLAGIPDLDSRFQNFPADDAYYAAGYTMPMVGSAARTTNFSYYVNENLSLFDKRLILTGGLRWLKTSGTTENWAVRPTTMTQNPEFNYSVYKYGVIVKPINGVSIYYTKAENVIPQVGFADKFAAGDQLDPFRDQEGQLEEIGVKWDKEITKNWSVYGSFAQYKMALTNIVLFLDIGLPGGPSRNQTPGDSVDGWEVEIGSMFKVSGGQFEMMGTYSAGNSEMASDVGQPIRQQAQGFAKETWSLLSKFTVNDGFFRNGFVGTGVRGQSAVRNGPYLLEADTIWSAFAGYEFNKHWSGQVNWDNITDRRYIVTYATTGLVLTNDPSRVRVSLRYTW